MQETKRKTEDAVRINKYLSQAGICSRRQADTYVEEGRVEVDGDSKWNQSTSGAERDI